MIQIRRAHLEDLPRIAAFQMAMAWESEKLKLDEPTLRQGIQRIFSEPQRGFYLMAEADGKGAIGCLLVQSEWSDWRNGEVYWLHSVYVEPAYRGQKVFRKLYDEVDKLVQADESIRGLRLYVERENHHAQKVYERLGMNRDHYFLYERMKTF